MNVQDMMMIVVGAVLLCAVVWYLWQSRVYRGFEAIKQSIRQIAQSISGSVRRAGQDMQDIVIIGKSGGRPVRVFFSNSDNSPGLVVHMDVPAGFNMWVTPKGQEPTVSDPKFKLFRLGTPDDNFNRRLSITTNKPLNASALTQNKDSLVHMQQLCCSTRTFLEVKSQLIQLSELLIPEQETGQHIISHINSMDRIAGTIERAQGPRKVTGFSTKQTLVAKVAAAVLVTLVVAGVGTLVVSSSQKPPEKPVTQPEESGLTPDEIKLIPDVKGWRLAQSGDFKAAVVPWLQGKTQQLRINAQLNPDSARPATAFILVGDDGTRRVVVLSGGKKVYDANAMDIAYLGAVRKVILDGAIWVRDPSHRPQADGLLLGQQDEKKVNFMVLYWFGDRIVSAVPVEPERLVR